ncbi:MAG: tail fiber protein [Prolixibacteraceae bacterium]|nr:tail fiber protein [Prolixibacteraceae bacterium]
MDGYLGEVKLFAGNYPPAGWVYCQGQILAIAQYQALYSVVGTTYGGNGTTSFGIPNLCGRVPLGPGTGTGLTPHVIGQGGGHERVALTTNDLPAHNHSVKCDTTSSLAQSSNDPEGRIPAKTTSGNAYGTSETGNPEMKADMINNTGGNQSHENMQPWLCINYIMCVEGMYPPRS